jgi:hypothetical protein
MGNQVSSQDENRKLNSPNVRKIIDKQVHENDINQNILFPKDNYSSYKGVKTELTDNPTLKDIGEVSSMADASINGDKMEDTNIETNTKPVENTKFSTLFEWKEGGNVVYLTGSFSNWSQWFVMTRNEKTNNFELSLDLPRAVHQYKFIVDNVWRFSKHHPTCNDGKGNINNIIDTTILINTSTTTTPKTETSVENTVFDKTQQKKNLLTDYSEYIPKKNELNTDAPFVPHHYAENFDIDHFTRMEHIGNVSFLNFSDRNHFSENNSFKSISIHPHVNL